MGTPDVAVVMPTYNEECVGAYLTEIAENLRAAGVEAQYVVVDDGSLIPVALTLQNHPLRASAQLTTIRNVANLGHGPTALNAYRAGLATGAPVVLHVDGDGQFPGSDFPRLIDALGDAEAVVGIRTGRREPWYRHVMTTIARLLVTDAVSGAADTNSPFRLYRADVLRQLVGAVSDRSLVPHLAFTVLERRWEIKMRFIDVAHRPRLGSSAIGTTWTGGRMPHLVPSVRLMSFAIAAAREVVALPGLVGPSGTSARRPSVDDGDVELTA